MPRLNVTRVSILMLGLCALFAANADAEIKTGRPAFDKAAKAAAAYLRGSIMGNGDGSGKTSIGSYALIKAGDNPLTSKPIQTSINAVLKKFQSTKGYVAQNQSKEIYEAGVDAMLLEAADPVRFRQELVQIVEFLKRRQIKSGPGAGGWDYFNGFKNKYVGDTSMAQYAMLAFWAAQRANIPVDLGVVDRCAAWHTRTQLRDGGFAYHPGIASGAGTGDGNSTGNMTAGGASSLGMAKLMLYKADKPKKKAKLFGVLEKVEAVDDEPEMAGKRGYSPSVSKGAIEDGMRRSYGWVTARLRPSMTGQVHKYYFYYTLERAAALNAPKKDLSWYDTCGQNLIKEQLGNGSFKGQDGDVADTACALLFLLRPTAKLVQFSGGVLKAKTGLPDDLARAFDPESDEPEKKKNLDPLDDLLAALEKMDFADTSDKEAEARAKRQQEIVEKIQNGDREELIGQVDRLKELAKHPNADVRRTALWALGRSGDLMVTPILINGLKDVDVSVMIEARNALCCVSRRANGFGLPPNPLDEMDSASADEKAEAALAWSNSAVRKWQRWWFKVRPYELRDDLDEAGLGGGE